MQALMKEGSGNEGLMMERESSMHGGHGGL